MQWRAPSGQHGLRCTFAGQQQGLLYEKAGSSPMVHKIAELAQQVVCTCRQEVADRLSALAQADSVRTQELSARQDALERSLREVGASCLSHNSAQRHVISQGFRICQPVSVQQQVASGACSSLQAVLLPWPA